jgi:hypothetical protein
MPIFASIKSISKYFPQAVDNSEIDIRNLRAYIRSHQNILFASFWPLYCNFCWTIVAPIPPTPPNSWVASLSTWGIHLRCMMRRIFHDDLILRVRPSSRVRNLLMLNSCTMDIRQSCDEHSQLHCSCISDALLALEILHAGWLCRLLQNMHTEENRSLSSDTTCFKMMLQFAIGIMVQESGYCSAQTS